MNFKQLLESNRSGGLKTEAEFIKATNDKIPFSIKKVNKNASINVEAETKNKEKIKRASQAKIVGILEKEYGKSIVRSSDLKFEVKNFNPVKWDAEALKDITEVWNKDFPKGSVIEIKDTSTSGGIFIFAEVFKVSNNKLASRINNIEAKEIFNDIVVYINEEVKKFIKEELPNKAMAKFGKVLDNWYLADKRKTGWFVKKINKKLFFRDVTTRIVDSYFKENDVGINRMQVVFEKGVNEEIENNLKVLLSEMLPAADISVSSQKPLKVVSRNDDVRKSVEPKTLTLKIELQTSISVSRWS